MRLTENNDVKELMKGFNYLPIDEYEDREQEWTKLALDKLGKLEDIEEELGIDLVILIKALKNGCYIKPWAEIKYSYEIRTGSDNINLFLLDENDNDYSLKDYGKTWALTKEELL